MKKLVSIVCIAIGAFSAHASYLYWQVDSDIADATQTWDGSGFDSAKITYTTGSGMNEYASYNTDGITLYDSNGNDTTATGNSGFGTFLASGEFNSGYTYYIELYNNSQLVSRSEGTQGSSLTTYTDFAQISSILDPQAGITVWMPAASGYTAVPEPTSAILMLFGAAMLGLKRKNRSIA